VSTEKTPGRAGYEARQVAKGRRMGARDDETDAQILAVIGLAWDELPAGMQADEEAGAQAVLDNRTPWGDVNVVVIAMGPRCAVVSDGPDGDVVKVIAYGDTGLAYYDSVEEWQAANAGPSDDFAADRPDRHADLDAGENGGAMTDADQEREAREHARDMAAEDGDLDDCEPTL
jgi:hypothetical protein